METPYPSSIDAEKGLLGSALMVPEKILGICQDRSVTPEWFSHPVHAEIFSHLVAMRVAKAPIDLISLTQWVESRKRLEECGGAGFITDLFRCVPTGSNWEYYLKIIQECYARKLGIVACEETARKLREECASLQDVHTATVNPFMDVHSLCVEEETEDRDKIEILSFMDKMQDAVDGKGGKGMMPFGLPSIDDETGGAQRGELVVVHGATSTGKSITAKLFTQKAAFERNERVAVFSLEMLHEQVLRRYVADLGNVSLQSMRKGIFSKAEFQGFSSAMARISAAPLHIYDVRRNEMTPQSIEREVRRLKKNKGLDMVMWDYLQLTRIKSNSEKRRDQELQSISTRLKLLAQELDFTAVLVAQANENGGCFDSSQVESDADWVFNMMPVYKNEGKIRRIVGTDGLWISKAREGQRGRKVPLFMDGKYARIGPPPPEAVRSSENEF